MSTIVVNMTGAGINGECALDGYADWIQCESMRHAIDVPVSARGSSRLLAVSNHGAIELTHPIDKATPALHMAASSGTNLGAVTVCRTGTIGSSSQAIETIYLGSVYIVRLDIDTQLDMTAYEPGDAVRETFALDYSEIRWEYNLFNAAGLAAGTVGGSWSVEAENKKVSV